MSAVPRRPFRPRRPLLGPSAAARGLRDVVATHAVPAMHRALQRATRTGDHGAPIDQSMARTVLLFFEDIEADTYVRGDRHVRRGVRRLYHAVSAGQRVSGFEVAFKALHRALERAGQRVVVNNYALARRHPEHPIGICGYPHMLDRWDLPNPAVIGPGLFDHPAQRPQLMDDPRFRSYIVPCDWMHELFAPSYGDKLRLWFGGIDVDEWPDTRGAAKDIDLLVYDKVRWNRATMVPRLLTPLIETAERRGLRVEVLKRGAYDIAEYRALLGRARGMLFVCETETQGLAYQEAMACNVPILAWDNGYWLDDSRTMWTNEPVPATSVPYFGAECGERFASVEEFPAALERFLAGRASYEPRRYVQEHLSLEESASLYLDAYRQAASRT